MLSPDWEAIHLRTQLITVRLEFIMCFAVVKCLYLQMLQAFVSHISDVLNCQGRAI